MAVTAAKNPFTKKRTAGIKQHAEEPKKGGAWTDTEKSLFESAIVLLGWGNWLAFTDVISTRDNKQIKSHAQKWEKYHPKEKAQLIEEYEARKIVEASISTGINMAAESGDVASGGGSSSYGGGGTKKKKRVARRRGSLTKAKTPTPTTTRARRRSSAPGNIMVHQEQKLPSGGGAISKRRGSLRSSIRNSIKKSTSSTSSSAAKKSSTTPTRKMSPEKNTKKTSSLSTSSHDIISSVTSRVSRVTLGEEPTTPPSNISSKCFNLMTPNAPTKQMVRNEEGETYDELAVLASTIYAPNSPDESTALASMVGNNVPYSPTDSSPGASSFNTTVAGQYDSNTCINMEDLVNELDLDLDLKSPPETPPSTKKEDVVPMKTEEGEEELHDSAAAARKFAVTPPPPIGGNASPPTPSTIFSPPLAGRFTPPPIQHTAPQHKSSMIPQQPPVAAPIPIKASNVKNSVIQAPTRSTPVSTATTPAPKYESYQHFNSKLLVAESTPSTVVVEAQFPIVAALSSTTTAISTSLTSLKHSNYSLFDDANRTFDLADVSDPSSH